MASAQAKRPVLRVAVEESGEAIDLDAWVVRYVSLVTQLDGWRTSNPGLASVA